MNGNLARDSNSRKPIFDEEKARVDPGGAEYSGRRPSPKLYEADNEVCRIEGPPSLSIKSFSKETLDYASLGAPLKVGWEGAGFKERCLKAVSVTPQRCKV